MARPARTTRLPAANQEKLQAECAALRRHSKLKPADPASDIPVLHHSEISTAPESAPEFFLQSPSSPPTASTRQKILPRPPPSTASARGCSYHQSSLAARPRAAYLRRTPDTPHTRDTCSKTRARAAYISCVPAPQKIPVCQEICLRLPSPTLAAPRSGPATAHQTAHLPAAQTSATPPATDDTSAW